MASIDRGAWLERAGRIYRRALLAILLGLAVLNAFGLAVYVQDTQALSALAASLVDEREPPSEQMRDILEFVSHRVAAPTAVPDVYFLLPIFRPLRATARQVVDLGGDCAYKTRALVVLLRLRGIHASKIALHDANGSPKHAVALVDTERGQYFADPLFGILYQESDGSPMRRETIVENHAVIIERERRSGNVRAETYPVYKYRYDRVATLNWKKSSLRRFTRGVLTRFMSGEEIDHLPMPFFAEEPALIVLVSSLGVILLLAAPLAVRPIARRVSRARAGPTATPANIPESRAS